MSVRVGTVADGAAAARLHVTSIEEGFLTRLGTRFLTRLYRRVARDDESFLLVDDDGSGRLVGMIAGSENVPALYKRFARRDGLVAATVAAPRLLVNAPRVLETWRYGGEHGDADVSLPTAELLSLAVEESARGRGIGRRLVAALNDEFARRGTSAVKVVAAAQNVAAIALYRDAGYRDAATIEVHRGTESKVLVWSPSSH